MLWQPWNFLMKLKKNLKGFKEIVAKLKDTGNGLIIKFPSCSSVTQDYYICLDYAEASYAYELLRKYYESFQSNP
jgi:hypothetical protein